MHVGCYLHQLCGSHHVWFGPSCLLRRKRMTFGKAHGVETAVWLWIAGVAAAMSCTGCMMRGAGANAAMDEWPYYGHDAGGARFSPLTQIDRTNVARLKPAWTFQTGDVLDR